MDCEDYENKIQLISNNYIQTILWTLNYYHDDCINWRIAYEYEYPPLLSDLHKHIPYFNNEITLAREMNPYHSVCSLVYIIPPSSYDLLPPKIKEYIVNYYNLHEYNIESMKFKYSYCRYFWEAHIVDEISDKININNIEKEILKLL